MTEDSDDADPKKDDDGSHARMLQNITGMPREAFEGNVVSGHRMQDYVCNLNKRNLRLWRFALHLRFQL